MTSGTIHGRKRFIDAEVLLPAQLLPSVMVEMGAVPQEEVADDFTGVVEVEDLPDHAMDPGHACEIRRFFTATYRRKDYQ